MAVENRLSSATSSTLSGSTRPRNVALLPRLSLILTIPTLLHVGTAHANTICDDARFVYPSAGLTFYRRDTINVSYRSDLLDPQLFLYCSPSAPVQKYATSSPPLNGSVPIHVAFDSSDLCWLTLQSGSDDACSINSDFFALSDRQNRPIDLDDIEVTTASATSIISDAVIAARAAPANPSDSDALSSGAKVGLAVAITGAVIAVAAMGAFFYFRRRKRTQDADAEGILRNGERRGGRRGPEKGLSRSAAGSESVRSGQSQEPLNPIQPVSDGFPGSMGYDDVRSLHSSVHLHSPTWPQSPASSHHGAFFPPPAPERSTDLDELTAARMHSSTALPTVISYGPNRVTPTLPSRPSELNVSRGNISIDSREGIPPMPEIPMSGMYGPYQVPAAVPVSTPSPPKKTVPLVVSYGPNRVTPTPVIKTSVPPPPNDAVMRNFTDWTVPVLPPDSDFANIDHDHEHDRQGDHPTGHQELETNPRRFSFDMGDEHYNTMAPLPPYASLADFNAMEKGAIRRMAAPQAQAELPPTKDGYYPHLGEIQEYELPGAAPQHAPQLPFNPYKNQSQGVGGHRDIDEQKFLLDDVEMAHLRAQKQKIRAAQAAAAATTAAGGGTSAGADAAHGEPGEAYEMTHNLFGRP